MRAICLPSRCLVSVPEYLAVLSASDRSSRKRSSAGSKSLSFKKVRLRRLNMVLLAGGVEEWAGSEGGFALKRAGHAVGPTTATTELETLDGDDFDARLAQGGVGAGVTFVGDHHSRSQGHDVVAVVPLLALGLEVVAA